MGEREGEDALGSEGERTRRREGVDGIEVDIFLAENKEGRKCDFDLLRMDRRSDDDVEHDCNA